LNGSILDLSDTDKALGMNLGTIATLLFMSDGAGHALLSIAQTSLSPSKASPIIDDVQISTTPLPGAAPRFATGLGALSLLGWRRKRKAAVAAA
jgi:hypothetical protein